MQQSTQMYAQFGMESSGDEFKELLLEVNPYLFGITMIVTVAHMIFEFLAMKNGLFLIFFPLIISNRYHFLEKCRELQRSFPSLYRYLIIY